MGALALTEQNLANQVSVVEEEIKVNVLNRPYGGFPWIPLPAVAFDTYPNAHNGYGDFVELEERRSRTRRTSTRSTTCRQTPCWWLRETATRGR